MKTLICHISLLSMFLLTFPDISAYFSDADENKKICSAIIPITGDFETRPELEDWLYELKGFIHKSMDYSDSEIEIEEWMTNEFSSSMDNKEMIEQELTIEDWMTKSFHFTSQSDSFDSELEIEPWMCRFFK